MINCKTPILFQIKYWIFWYVDRLSILSYTGVINFESGPVYGPPCITKWCRGNVCCVFRSLTVMLIVVSSYSILATVPKLVSTILNPMNNGITDLRAIDPYFFYRWAVDIIAPWNYCGNFFFYVLSGKPFRQELLLMILCRKRASGAFVFSCFFPKSFVAHYFNFLCCSYKRKQNG